MKRGEVLTERRNSRGLFRARLLKHAQKEDGENRGGGEGGKQVV